MLQVCSLNIQCHEHLQSCTVIGVTRELQKMEMRWELLCVGVGVWGCGCGCTCASEDTEMSFRHSHRDCIAF